MPLLDFCELRRGIDGNTEGNAKHVEAELGDTREQETIAEVEVSD